MSVSLLEVMAAARTRDASLVGEFAGYLVLAVADHVAGAPRRIAAAQVELSDDGKVRVTGGTASSDEQAARALRSLLDALLLVSRSVPPALMRASRGGSGGVEALIRQLEAGLIPVNRAAARRGLARLHKETERARSAGKLEPEPASPELAPPEPALPEPALLEPASPEPQASEPASLEPAPPEPASAAQPPAPGEPPADEPSIPVSFSEPKAPVIEPSPAAPEDYSARIDATSVPAVRMATPVPDVADVLAARPAVDEPDIEIDFSPGELTVLSPVTDPDMPITRAEGARVEPLPAGWTPSDSVDVEVDVEESPSDSVTVALPPAAPGADEGTPILGSAIASVALRPAEYRRPAPPALPTVQVIPEVPDLEVPVKTPSPTPRRGVRSMVPTPRQVWAPMPTGARVLPPPSRVKAVFARPTQPLTPQLPPEDGWTPDQPAALASEPAAASSAPPAVELEPAAPGEPAVTAPGPEAPAVEPEPVAPSEPQAPAEERYAARRSDVSELLSSFASGDERQDRDLKSSLRELAGLEPTPHPPSATPPPAVADQGDGSLGTDAGGGRSAVAAAVMVVALALVGAGRSLVLPTPKALASGFQSLPAASYLPEPCVGSVTITDVPEDASVALRGAEPDSDVPLRRADGEEVSFEGLPCGEALEISVELPGDAPKRWRRIPVTSAEMTPAREHPSEIALRIPAL